jgi:23S rRNA (cytosine1962-C5)-methyltransferase
MYPVIRLKAGKEAMVVFRHPWVYSGAIEAIPGKLENGSLVHVNDYTGKFLGTGTYSTHSNIAVRMLGYHESVIDQDWFTAAIDQANRRRLFLGYGPGTDTTGYRMVFGEVDGIPGLVIDCYEDVLVVQVSTAGIERLKEQIVGALTQLFHPRAIVERSDLAVRKEEGLGEVKELLSGEDVEAAEFSEHGSRFVAEVKFGQKTGFYLDQKDLRCKIKNYARDREVLNLFSNTGSFAVVALAGGARRVHNVDSSQPALDRCAAQLELNHLSAELVSSDCADVFAWLGARNDPESDMVVIDPPALVKSQHDLLAGRKAYHFLNRAALRLTRNGGILVTSSCSAFFPEEDFSQTLRRASVQAGVNLRLIHQVQQSPDHPNSFYFRESAYLKSFVCLVTR